MAHKFFKSIVASTFFIILLVTVHAVHIANFRVNVVLYTSITDVLIATIICSIILFTTRYFQILSGFEKSLLILIWLLVGYALAISVPTVIDRSLSFYILEKIQQRGNGIRQDAFENIFKEEYIYEHRLVDVRITEQLESGTIVINNGCVLLTPKGEKIAFFSRYYRTHWLPRQRLLMGKYSSDLTDPFRNGIQRNDYVCN